METQRTKILLVQNDHMGQIAFERFVRKESLRYDCVFVNSVSEGKRAFESEDYDVVVTDYMLIDGDACDLVSIVHIDVPVVVVTEAGDEDLSVKAMKAGATGYLIKDPDRNYLKTLPVTLDHAITFKRVEKELKHYHEHLLKIIEKRTHQLNEKNTQLYLEIQERKRAEEELRHTTEQLSVMLESLPIIPYACTAEDYLSITYVSNAIEEITGFTPGQFIKDSRFWTKHIHPGDRKHVLAELAVLPEQNKYHLEYRFRIADGSFKWFADTRSLVKLPDGTVSHIVGTWQDITEEKKLRQESEYRLQQIIQADKLASLGEVVAGVAHEINNPNSFITYNIPLLNETWEIFKPIITDYAAAHPDWRKGGISIAELCDDMGEIIQAIKTGSERINVVVANLKDFARIDESAHAKAVQVNEVVEKTLSIVGAQLRKSIAKIDVNYGDRLPEIQGHFQKLEQVVVNLVVNAAHAIPNREQGRLTITTRYLDRLKSVLIEVEDNGIGMEPEVMDRIFDPFFTTRRNAGGTGLGLSVSYGLVQEHRGIIGVHSRPGLGSHFTVLLPVDQETTLDLQPSILCVDDEETVLSLLRDSFAELKDMSLKITNTPEGVMAYLEEHPEVDIVLSDIAMPGIDGWELLKKIKRRFPLLSVILYTGHPYASEQKPKDTPDPDYLLRKPFKIKKLFELINKMDRQRL